MAEFEKSFFVGEERDGFYIEEMMKRAWAAEIEVLEVIDEICKRHEIRYFVDYGTLLGAVRHKGFIPWDDDIDISMLREDYDKFLKYAQKELPEKFVLGEARVNPDWGLEVARVLNGLEIGYGNEEHLKRFHGCPYIVGIDIFVLDSMPKRQEDEMLQCQLLHILRAVREQVGVQDEISAEMEQTLEQLEQLLNVKIDRSGNLINQCLRLSDHICRMYEGDDGEEITYYHWMLGHEGYRFKKEWYEETVWLPFETILVPAPAGYHEVLKVAYGEDYMVPKQIAAAHDYPFYKSQEEMWRNVYGK